ncbi:hypothetical protein ABTE26_21030, partial [Acinetobacter baumannii]
LPFEKDYFKNNWNWEVEYVGHPLIEVIRNFQSTIVNLQSSDDGRQTYDDGRWTMDYKNKCIALLPGSRKQEISKKLPIM